MPSRLVYPLRPKAEWDEGVGGYLCRYFGANGYRIPREIEKALGTSYRLTPLQLERQDAKPLTEFFLQEDLNWLNSRMQVWLATSVSGRRFAPRPPKICPVCIRQFNFYRAVWDCPSIDVCTIHYCLLQTHCSCGRRFTWARLGPDWQCLCGQAATGLSARVASAAELQVAKLISSRILRAFSLQQHGFPMGGQLQRINRLHKLIHHLVQLLKLAESLLGTKVERCLVLGRLLYRWPWGFIRTVLRALRWSYRGMHKEHFIYVHSGSEMGRFLKWLETFSNSTGLYSCQVIATALRNRFGAPISTSRNIIANPALTERQQAQRLEVFAIWWGNSTLFKPEVRKQVSSHARRDFHCLVLRLQLINVLIQAANERVSPALLHRLIRSWPGTPPRMAPTPSLLIQLLDQELATFSRRTLRVLYDEARLALAKEQANVHV